MDLETVLDVPELVGTRWSVEVLDADGQALAGCGETELLPTASLAKVFLLAEVAERIAAGELDPAEVLDRRGWPRAGCRPAPTCRWWPGAFDLDPLAHPGLWHKTGTEAGVRTDAGTVSWRGGRASYAALCVWDGDALSDVRLVTPVLAAMRGLGAVIRRALAG